MTVGRSIVLRTVGARLKALMSFNCLRKQIPAAILKDQRPSLLKSRALPFLPRVVQGGNKTLTFTQLREVRTCARDGALRV